MSWFWLALLAPAVYATANFLDKYVISEKVQDIRGLPVYSGIIALFFGTILWLFMGMPLLPSRDAVIIRPVA